MSVKIERILATGNTHDRVYLELEAHLRSKQARRPFHRLVSVQQLNGLDHEGQAGLERTIAFLVTWSTKG